MTIKFPNALKNNILLKMIFLSEIYKKDENIIKDLVHNVDEMIRLVISISIIRLYYIIILFIQKIL